MSKKWLFIGLLLASIFATSALASGECSWTKLNIQGPDGVRVEDVEVRVDHGTIWGSVWMHEHQVFITSWAIEPELGQQQIHITVVKSEDFLLGEYSGPMERVITIHLQPDTSAGVRGRIQDQNGRAVSGMKVTVDEFPVSTVTDAEGRFHLDLHTGDGKTVRILAVKQGCETIDEYVMAGEHPEIFVCECQGR